MRPYRRVWFAVLLLTGWSVIAWGQANRPYRFLVMSDPQFRVARPGDQNVVNGYRWTSPVWASMPQLSQRLGARFLFVCGDIFEYKDGDGSTINGLWNNWDRYTKQFPREGMPIEWTTGGHEFWGGGQDYDYNAKELFLNRYPDKVRYTVHNGENLFILFDDIHDPTFLDAGGTAGLAWLAATLEAAHEKRIFFFGHVPPRSTASWWPDGTGAKVDSYRSKMAELLTKRRITAAFFGHEHFPSYLGDAGGFPVFVTAFNTPLLVEIQGDQVSYRWLKAPLAEDPLAQVSDAINDQPVQKLYVAAIPPGRKLADAPPQVDPTIPLRLDDGSAVAFQAVAPDPRPHMSGVPLSQIASTQAGGQIIAIAEVPRESTWAQHFRVRSGVPGTVYFNSQEMGRITANPQRWNDWLVRADRNRPNRVTVVLDVTNLNASFAVVPQTRP